MYNYFLDEKLTKEKEKEQLSEDIKRQKSIARKSTLKYLSNYLFLYI